MPTKPQRGLAAHGGAFRLPACALTLALSLSLGACGTAPMPKNVQTLDSTRGNPVVVDPRTTQQRLEVADARALDTTRIGRLERWRSYVGVSWAIGSAGPFTLFDHSVDAPIAGVHFDALGRAFVSTPRLISAGAPATLSLLDASAESGPARLIAFPSLERNAVGGAPDRSLRNVWGFHVDQRNGLLWALDQGWVAGETEAPPNAQKLMVFDLASGNVVATISLDAVADRKGSFLNDIAVDEARKLAFISDSALRSPSANRAGLIVVDLRSGTARRVLGGHPALQAVRGAKILSHGAEVWPGKPRGLGINGVALSPDGETLYWTVTSGTRLRAVPTSLLRDTDAELKTVAAGIRDLGDIGGNTTGIVADGTGRVYVTDVTRRGIVRYDPQTGRIELVASDERVRWPDAPAIDPTGNLVFTASSLNDHLARQVKPGSERYDLWRLPLLRRD
jgi:sugar lactone lactonase YvrE